MNWWNFLILLGFVLRAAFPHGIHSVHRGLAAGSWPRAGQGWTEQSCLHRDPRCPEGDAAETSFSKYTPRQQLGGTEGCGSQCLDDFSIHPAKLLTSWCPWEVTECIPGAHWNGVLMRPPWPKPLLPCSAEKGGAPDSLCHDRNALWKGREVSWAQLSEIQLIGHHCSN